MRGWVFLFFITLVFQQSALADMRDSHPIPEVKCITDHYPNGPRIEKYGDFPIRFEELLQIEMGGNQYIIPAGYLDPRPDRKEVRYADPTLNTHVSDAFDIKGINKRDEIGVTFWMPALRYTEMEHSFPFAAGSCENGRPKPDLSHEFVVGIKIKEWSLQEQWKDLKRKLLRPARNILDDQYGLIASQSTDDGKPYIYYESQRDAPIEVYLECGAPQQIVKPYTCKGRIYSEKDKLYYYVSFPAYHINKWRDIIGQINILINQWKQ